MSFIDGFVSKIFGSKKERDLKSLQPIIENVNAVEAAIKALSNDELRSKTTEFKTRIQDAIHPLEQKQIDLKKEAETLVDILKKEDIYDQIDALDEQIFEKSEEVLQEILPEAFAVMRETATRFAQGESLEVTAQEHDIALSQTKSHISVEDGKAHWDTSWQVGGNLTKWNMIHYDVQLIGGKVLHDGKIAEMQTGEGKTLVATLPVYINALPGRGVHVVTVNDYLAKRDCEWMAPLFEFHGLSVACLDNTTPNSPERKQAYQSDITYGTNNEFGFDYLRDNTAFSPDDLVQRKHNYAIIDEVDSVLIDDARTPLIISGPVPNAGDTEIYNNLKSFVQILVDAQRKLVSQELRDAKTLLDSGDTKEGGQKLLRSFRGLPKSKPLIKYLSTEGTKTLLQKTENFYMQDQNKEMHIIDDELYFTIDEKSNQIELTEKGINLLGSRINDDSFFILPDISIELAKIDTMENKEDALDKKETLLKEYSQKGERIHAMNQLLKAYTLFEKDVEYLVQDNKVMIVDEQTGRVMQGRRYSDGLHQALEAKENVKIEGLTQTYATITLQNYFRMYNKLSGMTGTAETEAKEFFDIYELDVVLIPTNKPVIRKDEEDKVYKTVREKFNAVVEEIVMLQGKGRPVLVGTTSVETSELLSRFLKLKGIHHEVLNAKQHAREADIVANAGKKSAVTIATNMAGRGTDIKLADGVKELGGLAIIGTERHDSRRVDRQLRGRSGRQGDPGSSQFFVSLEDDLMRRFGSERVAKMMDRLKMEEGEMIQHKWISDSIGKAQKKVEENNFGSRKRLLEFDDALNLQREVIYKRRKHALHGERIQVDIANSFADTVDGLVSGHKANRDFENLELDVISLFGQTLPFSENDFDNSNSDKLSDQLLNSVVTGYKAKQQKIQETIQPAIERIANDPNTKFEFIVIPFTDGEKAIQLRTHIANAISTSGKSITTDFEKSISLNTIDTAWKLHLREMDSLKSSVQHASWEQKDPLLIYKMESFNLFRDMLEKVNKDILKMLSKFELPKEGTAAPNSQNTNTRLASASSAPAKKRQQLSTNRSESSTKSAPLKVQKTGRNEPCPCGSGKKFKHCHGAA